MEIVTSWERKGIEKGRMEGLMEGQIKALRTVLLDVLSTRFGKLEDTITTKVEHLDSIDDRRRLTHLALTAGSVRDSGL